MSKKVFCTYYDRERPTSCSGSHILDGYSYKVSDDGHKELVRDPSKDEDVFEKIQSWKDSVSLKAMIERFNYGDENALNVVEGVYGDFKEMPKTYAEMVDRLQKCSEVFEGLPTDIKSAFKNDPNVFWQNFGSAEFVEKVNNLENSRYERMIEELEKNNKELIEEDYKE